MQDKDLKIKKLTEENRKLQERGRVLLHDLVGSLATNFSVLFLVEMLQQLDEHKVSVCTSVVTIWYKFQSMCGTTSRNTQNLLMEMQLHVNKLYRQPNHSSIVDSSLVVSYN